MAISKGQASTEGVTIKRFIGVGSVKILAVNPNKSKLEEIFNAQLDKDPEYLSETDSNGKRVANVRIEFIIKTEDQSGIEVTTKMAFFIRNEYRFNKDQTKVQVIDKYGRTCWVTKEQCKNHEIPMYSNGPANIDKEYRPCFVGEEDLTNFIKNYLNIPNVMRYVNSTWVLVDNPEDCECRLDNIDNYFKGNYSELNDILSLQPDNKVKVLFGVRTTDDGRQYQSIYTQMTVKNGVSDYTKLKKDLEDRKANGAYSTTEFEVCPLKEYVVTPTSFENSVANDLPFTSSTGTTPWDF